ncbi:hypothetical protein C8J56DRAFT_932520 [Mycena floridula]|nr:hypothetical protein C8J56DRAFT_932520 [Mycena floridula]
MNGISLGLEFLHAKRSEKESTIEKSERDISAYVVAEWPGIHRWLTFFVQCLDLHRQATVIVPEHHDRYEAMLYSSSGIIQWIAFSEPYDIEKTMNFLASKVPGYMSVMFQLMVLPSYQLTTPASWALLTGPLITISPLARKPEIADEFVSAMVKCLDSPGGIESFLHRMKQEITDGTPVSKHDLSSLLGYIAIPFCLVAGRRRDADSVRRAFFVGGMASMVTRAMALAQDPNLRTDVLWIQFMLQCTFYIYAAVNEEGYASVMAALKGSSGVLFSISSASQLLFRDNSGGQKIPELAAVAQLYVEIIKEITVNLIHPAVMRRCSRRLRKHSLLLKTEDPHLQPLVDAGKILLKAVGHSKSIRTDYKKQDRKLCCNSQCPHPSVKPTSVKFCGGCLTTTYCSSACQKSDWKEHRQKLCHEQALERQSWDTTDKILRQITRPIHTDYLHWVMTRDTVELVSPKGPSEFVGQVIDLDYTCFPPKKSVISVAEFLVRPIRFPNDEPDIRESIIQSKGKAAFIYAAIPNGLYTSFPRVLTIEPYE